MTTTSDLMQQVAGTLLFIVVVIWAAIKIMNTPFPKDEEEDDDIHLGD